MDCYSDTRNGKRLILFNILIFLYCRCRTERMIISEKLDSQPHHTYVLTWEMPSYNEWVQIHNLFGFSRFFKPPSTKRSRICTILIPESAALTLGSQTKLNMQCECCLHTRLSSWCDRQCPLSLALQVLADFVRIRRYSLCESRRMHYVITLGYTHESSRQCSPPKVVCGTGRSPVVNCWVEFISIR